MAQRVRWLAFCMSHALTRTVFHFFPSADNASAPYTAACTLTLFGSATPAKSVVLDGARLGYPDGLRLEDAFPILRSEGAGMFGLLIEITSAQPRLDLGGSGCVVELASSGYSTKFWPVRLPEVNPSSLSSSANNVGGLNNNRYEGMLLRDDMQRSSVILINGSDRDSIGSLQVHGSDAPQPTVDLNAWGAVEVPIDDATFTKTTQHECSWGNVCAMPCSVEFSERLSAPEDASSNAAASRFSSSETVAMSAAYFVCRDATTRRVLSVNALSQSQRNRVFRAQAAQSNSVVGSSMEDRV